MAASRNCNAAVILLMSFAAPVTRKTLSTPESSMPVKRRVFSEGQSTGIPRYNFVLRMTRRDPDVRMTNLDEEGGAEVLALSSAMSLRRRRPRPRSVQFPVDLSNQWSLALICTTLTSPSSPVTTTTWNWDYYFKCSVILNNGYTNNFDPPFIKYVIQCITESNQGTLNRVCVGWQMSTCFSVFNWQVVLWKIYFDLKKPILARTHLRL